MAAPSRGCRGAAVHPIPEKIVLHENSSKYVKRPPFNGWPPGNHGAAGTGGFGTYGNSIAHFNSPAVDLVIGIFMALFGVNFSLYYFVLKRNWRAALGNSEMRLYWAILLGATVLIAINIMPLAPQAFCTLVEGKPAGSMNFLTALR